ncbi:MAG TPA: diacylglycerol kinase family protein [Thermoanaerobaculia bacterium]|nr:diacylglycerol kinase family protein [Thermoanaerobaculia bacterium]
MTEPCVRFLVNPASGRGTARSNLDRIRVLASRHGAGLVVSRKVSDLAEQARRAAEDGVERLLVAGGDGTMHYAAQGLAGTDCAMGVIPLGSGNDLAGTLGIPPDLDVAVERALTGESRRIDLLRIGETYSLSYAGVGFDSEVTRFANEVKILRGPLIYFYAVIHTLITFEPPRMKVVHDGGTFEGRVMFIVVNNLPRFGGGMRIAPDAQIDDGLLDLVIVREVPKPVLLSIFPKVYNGRHVGHPAVTIVRTRRAEITIDRDMTLYGGGEPLRPMAAGEAVAIEVMPAGLAVVTPPP